MSGVTVQVKGKESRIDVVVLADIISPLVVGHIIERNDSSMDTRDRPFRRYSTAYYNLLLAEGESTVVDHRRKSNLMSSVRETERRRIGRDTMRVRWGVSPSMTVIAVKLQSMRRWFGVSPKGDAAIGRAIVRAKNRALKQLGLGL